MPTDLNSLTAKITDIATNEQPEPDDGKNPAAVALGRLGGKKGGAARAANLTPERRKEIAQKAAPDALAGRQIARLYRAPTGRSGVRALHNEGGRHERASVATLPTITAPEQLGGLAWSPLGNAILVASGGSFREEVYDLKTAHPSATVAYGAWPSWVAVEITAP